MSLYNIVLEIQDSDPVVIKRSQEALELFSRDLESYFLPPQIDAFRVALASQHSIPSNDIQEFLLYCFRNVDIVQSKAVAQFLWDPSEESPPSSPALSAIDFILQPLENQQIYIPQNQQFFIDVRLAKGEALVWRYQVGCGQEIDFFALCCPALFRSLKPHPNTDTVDEICETKDINGIDATNSSNSPKSYDHKLSLSLDEFIKSGQHRSIDKSQKEPNFPSSNISIVTATYATLSSESWHYIPFMRSFSSPQSSFPCRPPLTGCYQAQTGGGLCRLLWDNTVVSLSGKHLEYCVQKVSEETMQAALKAADDISFAMSVPRSKSYLALLSCSSPINIGVTVDGPYDTEVLENIESSASLSSQYLEDMAPGDHLRFVIEKTRIQGNTILEDNDIVLPPSSTSESPANSTAISTHNSWPVSSLISSLYSLPIASGTLVSLGVTNGVAGLGVIGGLVKSIVSPFAVSRQVQTSLKDTTPNTAVTANSIEHNNEGSPRSRSWIASLLTPYVRAAWAGRNNPAVVEEMNLRSPNQSDSTMLQDLLTLARRVDELEDEVSLKTAERDQLRVQLEIIRQHNETEREELLKKQIIFENEYIHLRDSAGQSMTENQSNDEEIRNLRLRAERAEELLEKSYKEVGVWQAARIAVEQRLAELSSDQEVVQLALMKLEAEKQDWMMHKIKWDEERRELCQRVAELEKEKDDPEFEECLNHDSSLSSPVNIALLRERDELAQTVADYVRRLDELQSEALLYRAQRRIDEREIKILRRECEEKVLIAKSEALECRMIMQQLREKLKKVKGEKKVLIAELRALREIGLYQGPLTRDGHEFSNAGAKEISDEHPQIEAGDSQLKNSTMEREKYDEVETEMLPYQIMLLELEERKRVIQSMLKADPESRSLQQLSLQLETQSQSILERIQTFTGSSSTPMNFAGSGAPLPSHEEWLQKSFQEWNSV